MNPTSRTSAWQQAWPFAMLCLVSASRWIAADQWPQTGSTLRSELVACVVAALLCSLFRIRKQAAHEALTVKWLLWTTAAGVALLALPALGAALTGSASEPFNRTAAMCFVPLIAAVTLRIRSGTGMQALTAPLAGIAGALFLFPLALPVEAIGWLGLVVPPLSAGLVLGLLAANDGCGAHAHTTALHPAVFCAGGAIGLVLIEGVRMHSTHDAAAVLSLAAVALDCLVVAGVLLAVTRLGARRYATRYLFTPVITVLEGTLILRPGFSLRVWTGLLLLAGAAFAAWQEPLPGSETTSLPLR